MGHGRRVSCAVVEVIFAPAAIADLIAIRSYIGHFNPAATRRLCALTQKPCAKPRRIP
ncbi:protein of unknown function [Azospirillum lipoferum 4B]|uniref:Type II toxin-antitoxin system RelE/ParE family toxin n=1 Tax=Azospirillum lipoferum (strain 4B) TaxID=862719 RepID=G7Z2H3_AZOL4|nr:protein of unknown function [Azospirillum lipoferum 4B]